MENVEKDVKGEKEAKKVDTLQVSTFHLPEAEAPYTFQRQRQRQRMCWRRERKRK